MSFRNFINNGIISIIKNNPYQPKLFFFQIGCFPSSEENINHEYPYIINKYKQEFPNLQIYQVWIDQMYKENPSNHIDSNILIYPEFITPENYNSIVELCHFMNNYNTLSIIMEFTSTVREQYFNKENMTDYLYITPSECIIDTRHILFNPILKYQHKYCFFRPDKEPTLSKYLNNNVSMREMEFIMGDLERRKKKLTYFKSVLSIMRMDLEDGNIKVEKNYNKNYSYFFMITKNIQYRLGGYENYSTKILLEEFKNGEQKNLEVYIYDIVFNILHDSLVFLYRDKNLIEENYGKILFSNDNELQKCIDYFIINSV
jgi:hypothetical protein